MGVCLRCEKTGREIDMGYGGFMRLRRKVAELCGETISAHYQPCCEPWWDRYGDSQEERDAFWDSYDAETLRLIQEGILDLQVAEFLFQSDAGGKLPAKGCKVLLEIVGDYDDDIIYGYAGLPHPAMFRDFKEILEDCVRTRSKLVWH